MKRQAHGSSLDWIGWLALLVILAGTLGAWWLSRNTPAADLLIEPLPAGVLEVHAPDSTESDATETAPADEPDESGVEPMEPTTDAPDEENP